MRDAAHFDEQGYITARALFGSSEIERLTRVVDRIFCQWLEENRADYVESRLVNMHSLTSPKYFQGHAAERLLLFQLLASDPLIRWLDRLFGDGLYFHNTQLFFNPCNKGRSPYWHRDMQYTPIDEVALRAEQHRLLALHVRIPLLPEQGLELIPGTHKRWDTPLEHDVRLELNGRRSSDGLPGAVLIDLMPGDVLIFSAQMIHRGNYCLNDSRKALDLCIGREHPYTTPYLDASTLPTEDELARIADNRWYRTARQIAAAAVPVRPQPNSQHSSGASA